MDRSIRLSEFLFIISLILVAFIAGSFAASFVAASQVENHIDNTIAKTVKDAQDQSRNSSAAAQKLFTEVDTICKSLEATNSAVHC